MADRTRPPRRRGNQGENADQRRKRERTEAVAERERMALEMFVQGKTYAEIGSRLDVSYSTAHRYVHYGLERRAAQDGEIAGKARAFLQMQIEALMGVWMPRALGTVGSLDGEQNTPPDPRAAEIMHRYIRQYAEITGALAPIRVEGDMQVTRPLDEEEATAAILGALARMGAKSQVIEGHLADVGHTTHELTTGEHADALPPPIQEKAA
jgi:DNA-binding CsgD family transcriptional regulator